MLRRRADVKQPTGAISPESTAPYFGQSPVSPVSAAETGFDSVELEGVREPAELQADINRLSITCRGAGL